MSKQGTVQPCPVLKTIHIVEYVAAAVVRNINSIYLLLYLIIFHLFRYFECRDKYGLFAPVGRVSKYGPSSGAARRTSAPQTPRATVRRSNSRESLGGSSVASSTASSVRGTRVRLGVTSLTPGQVLSPNFLLLILDVVRSSGFMKSTPLTLHKHPFFSSYLLKTCCQDTQRNKCL